MPRAAEPLDPSASARDYYGWLIRHHRGERSQRVLATRLAVSEDLVQKLERAATWPTLEVSRDLDRVFQTGETFVTLWSLVKRERERDREPVQPRAAAGGYDGGIAKEVDATNRQRFIKTVGVVGASALVEGSPGPVTAREIAASVNEATELARFAEASEVGRTNLDALDLRVQSIAEGYRVTQFDELFREVRDCKRKVAGLMVVKHTSAEDRHLSVLAAQLAGLLSDILFGIGHHDAAWVHSLAGVRHARDAGHPELLAWLHGLQSMIRSIQGRHDEALRLAQDGERYARDGSAASVLLYGKLARAAARVGRPEEARRAMGAGEHAWNTLPTGVASNSVFSVNDGLRSLYSGAALLWIGEPEAARDDLARAIELYRSAAPEQRSATTETHAALDDATALIELGEPGEGARIGTEALATYAAQPRQSASIVRRARELEVTLAAHKLLPMVRDYRERLRALEAPKAISAN